MVFEIYNKQQKVYQGLRIWGETHAIFKRLAKKHGVPMTVLLHSIALNIAKAESTEDDQTPT